MWEPRFHPLSITCLFKARFMSEDRFMFQWCLVFILVAMRIVSQDYIMRDDLAIDASLSIVKKIKII